MWTRAIVPRTTNQRARPKALGKSLLSKKGTSSGSGESAAVHFVQLDLAGFNDEARKSDNDPAVVKTVETLSVVGSDVLTSVQEKEARSSGGIPSR